MSNKPLICAICMLILVGIGIGSIVEIFVLIGELAASDLQEHKCKISLSHNGCFLLHKNKTFTLYPIYEDDCQTLWAQTLRVGNIIPCWYGMTNQGEMAFIDIVKAGCYMKYICGYSEILYTGIISFLCAGIIGMTMIILNGFNCEWADIFPVK